MHQPIKESASLVCVRIVRPHLHVSQIQYVGSSSLSHACFFHTAYNDPCLLLLLTTTKTCHFSCILCAALTPSRA
jgi:hypothetical protein